MAWQIVADVQYHAPRDLTSGELAVLLAIADAVRQVNVATRRARVSHEEVAWKARLKVNGVRDAVSRLAQRGALVRVPIGTDRRGQPAYTHRGSVPSYVVPTFEPDADHCPCYEHHTARAEGAVTTAPFEPEGAATTAPCRPEGAVTTAEGAVVTAEGAVTTAEGAVPTAPHRVSPGLSEENRGDARAHEPTAAVVLPLRDDPPTPVIDGEILDGEIDTARRYPQQCDAHQDGPNTHPCFPCKAAREEAECEAAECEDVQTWEQAKRAGISRTAWAATSGQRALAARRAQQDKPRSTRAAESVDAAFENWTPPTIAPRPAATPAPPPPPPPADETPDQYWARVRRIQGRHG